MDESLNENVFKDATVLTQDIVSKLLPLRYQNSNKGTYGTVLNIAGCAMYPGAAYLSSVAALKSGAGLVKLATETSTIGLVASQTPDVTYIDLGHSEYSTIPKDALKILKDIEPYRAVSIGCGLSTANVTKEFVINFLTKIIKNQIPVIIDADAINILSTASKMPIPLNSIITPHPLELSRLMDVSIQEIQAARIRWAKESAKYLDCIVVLKGKNTVIAVPNGQTFVNPTGNSSLSKAGAGDILTGMIAGFAAQGVKLEDAACLACYLHGRMGEMASLTLSEYSVLASNLINFIPFAIKEILPKSV